MRRIVNFGRLQIAAEKPYNEGNVTDQGSRQGLEAYIASLFAHCDTLHVPTRILRWQQPRCIAAHLAE
jgi:hypothetical protein